MMPPTTAATTVTLRELADLAIGTPEVGAVNFTALHTLIVAMLKHLSLLGTRVDYQSASESGGLLEPTWSSHSAPHLSPETPAPKERRRSGSRAQPPALESQVKDLSQQLKAMGSRVQDIASQVQHICSQASEPDLPPHEWLEKSRPSQGSERPDRTHRRISKPPKDSEVVPAKAAGLLQDLVDEVRLPKEAQEKIQELPALKPQEILQRIEEVEKIVRDRDEFLELMGRKLSLIPGQEEVTMVTWEELEQAITDGWRASQAGSETLMGLPKRRRQLSLTASDLAPGGASAKHPSAEQALGSAAGFGPDQTISASSGAGQPSAVASGEQVRGLPGREQHPRAHEEAGTARSQQPPGPQVRAEVEQRRGREQLSPAHPRRDERAAQPGPQGQGYSGLPWSQGQVYLGPDHHGLGTPSMGQPGLYPSTGPRGVVPHRVGQLGMLPPSFNDLDSALVGMGQHGVMPPSVDGRDQQGLELPGADQHGIVPFGTYQHHLAFPSTDQRSMAQPGMEEGGMAPLSTDQQGLVWPGLDQHGFVSPLTYQHGLVPPGLMPFSADQQGLVRPSLEISSVIQPGVNQHNLTQPGRDQRDLVQPGAYLPGLVQPGVGQPGLVQPGVGQPGLVQPGAYPPSMVQSGMYPHGLVQPGTDQPGLVEPGVDQPGLVEPGADQPGLVEPGADQPGLVEPGADQPGLQPGAYPRGLMQPGAYPRGLMQPRMYPRGLVYPGMYPRGLVQPGMYPRGLVQPEMYPRGLVQPGMYPRGLVQPGTDQHGVVQPGMNELGVVQPGADQHGLAQPGGDQHGLAQPGADQHGLTQPGADQRGLAQPGMYPMYPRGLVHPGMYRPGLVHPGADQHGLMQPRMYPRGLVQPGMDQRGSVQPGTDQRGLEQPGTDESGLVQPGADQHELVQPGLDQHGLMQPGLDQHGLVQPGLHQRGLVQPGADHQSLVQPGTDENGLSQHATEESGLVQPGADQHGLVQPGVDQQGLVQPGAGQLGMVQPGVDWHGLVQPSAYPHGLARHGAYPPSVLGQTSTDQHVPVQSGAYPHGFAQPTMDQYGLRQLGPGQQGLVVPGTAVRDFPAIQADFRIVPPYQYQQGVPPLARELYGQVSPLLASQGLAPPGIDQRGLVPPGTYWQGLVHPGTDQHGPTPVSTGLESAHPDQGHLAPPGPDQQHQVTPGAALHGHAQVPSDYRGPTYPGYRGPVYSAVDRHRQDPNRIPVSSQPGVPVQTGPGQDGTFLRSRDSLSYLGRGSSDRDEAHGARRDSLDKVAPSFPIAVETFRLMGELLALYAELKESLRELDEEQAGQTDLEKIQHLLSQMVKKIVPPDLQEQIKGLKALAKEFRQEKAKLEKIQRMMEGDGEQETGKELRNGQLSLQLGILRVTVADIEKELAELRASQEQGKAIMENSMSEASYYLQDQLDKLRTVIESMLASSSTLLSMSMPSHKAPVTSAPGQIDPEATCPACSLDLSHQVSLLVQRYEQLQDMVNNLAASRPSKKAKLQSQDEELLGHVQSAILQVQGDCEKLNITTSNLIEDHRQKQKDIEMLYQGLEKLEKEKANREHLEMEIDVKADKSALAGKVSRVQFDATTEQLNHMMQELVAKMSGQEQDWQKMLDKLLLEMDSKLDRLELDPVKQLLEDRWKSLRQQLKERSPLYQADEAAAMRRQLLAHFHCLSCDRPLETPVTGQMIPVTPLGPSLPGHRSIRPYTVFELEQVRRQSRNFKLGSGFPRGDLSQTDRSVRRLRTMHSKMLMDIEKVQIHFGGSTKASSQMIRELLQAQCLSSPCYKRMPDMADYTYSTVPRRCGGSHTLTYPYHRNRLQHLSQGLYPAEEVQIAMKHDEVDILGLDGHIYKGRMDTRLPGIVTKEGLSSKHKPKLSRPHVHRQQSLSDSSQPPSRPQSAQTLAGSHPVSLRQQDRPVSSQGRLSELNVVPPLSSSDAAALPGLQRHLDVPPREGLEEPTRGPRSTPAH